MSDSETCSCNLSSSIDIIIKLTTLVGLLIIGLDIMLITETISINETSMIVKNVFSILNAILFSLSCTLYVFKFNQEVLKNDMTNLCLYFRNSDLRVKGLEIIGATEIMGLSHEERFKFRDSILFRAKLKHCGFILELMFFYFNALAYGKLYRYGSEVELSSNRTIMSKDDVYMLNLYVSVISPILSIMFSYITILCNNIVVIKNFVGVIMENRDQEDFLMVILKKIIEYPVMSVFECMTRSSDNEPSS